MTHDTNHRLAAIFHHGAADASTALAKWLGRPAALSVDRLDLLPIEEAAAVMGSSETLICGCAMRIDGAIGGLLLLAADDDAGLSLADTLLERPTGTSTSWGDLERSAVHRNGQYRWLRLPQRHLCGARSGRGQRHSPLPTDFPARLSRGGHGGRADGAASPL